MKFHRTIFAMSKPFANYGECDTIISFNLSKLLKILFFSIFLCVAMDWLITKQKLFLVSLTGSESYSAVNIPGWVCYLCFPRQNETQMRANEFIGDELKTIFDISDSFCWRWPVPLEWHWSFWLVPWKNTSNLDIFESYSCVNYNNCSPTFRFFFHLRIV